jgi:nucleotidyltransferase/DNA polymerase involved in DNA repair
MIPPAERRKMLAVPLCGPRVISRLEAIGIRSLRELADRDPDELVFAVNVSAGRPIWRQPLAHLAMETS